MDLRRTPPDSEPPKPVEEPPERPQTEPPAPVREPDPTPPDYLGSRVQKVTFLFLVCFGVFLQDIPAQDAVAPGATTITNIEQLPGWQSCDTCSGGGKVPYSMAQGLDDPVLLTTRFSIGRGVPWSHALWWKRLGNNSNISHFEISLDEYIEDPDSSWGIEYNVNQLLDNQWFKFSTQLFFRRWYMAGLGFSSQALGAYQRALPASGAFDAYTFANGLRTRKRTRPLPDNHH